MNIVPNFISLKKLSLEEYLIMIDSIPAKMSASGKIYKNISRRKMHWVNLIKSGNLICPVTGKSVSYCSYDELKHRKGDSTYHYNFYSEDGELFSIDHKVPISKGGSVRSMDNIQPMLITENFKKSNDLIYT